MAEKNTDKIVEKILLLQANKNSSSFPPTLGSGMSDNFDRLPDPKPKVNLQLSLGGFYDKTSNSLQPLPNSFSNPTNSMLKRSYFERNTFLQKDVAGVKIDKEIQMIATPKNQLSRSVEAYASTKSNEVNTLVSPLEIPIWAAQSAFGNPAFRRAINVIRSNGTPSIRRSTNLMGYTSGNPNTIKGFGSQLPVLYQEFNNGKPIGFPFNNGTNQRFFVPQMQPENLNLVAPINFHACGNSIPYEQLQVPKLVPPFNCSITTIDRPPCWTINGNLMMHPLPTPLAPSISNYAGISLPFPTTFGPKGHNISIVPQNATGFPNARFPSFLPISRNGIRPIPLPRVLLSKRSHHNPVSLFEHPCKRARHDNLQTREAELQLMKQLPTVVTTGRSPNRKKIEGLLYNYRSDQQVTIICVCHGCFFTPEEFVRHAGGSDVGNPMQQISVLDYPNYLKK